MSKYNNFYKTALGQTLSATIIVALLAVSGFLLAEPRVGQAVDSSEFTIKQTITGEISFSTQPVSVGMNGSLNGMTGGTSNGSTTVVVKTNSTSGYTMDIAFEDNGQGVTMLGDNISSFTRDSIKDHPDSSGQPFFNFATPTSSALFGYNINASRAADLDPSFLNDGTNCNAGSGNTVDRCWMRPSTTAFRIINRNIAAPNGATTTINFRVVVPNNPVPGIGTDVYTATATLTALIQ